MKDLEYGISDVEINGKVSKTVKFGDGKTRIFSVFWEGVSGVNLVRSSKIDEVCLPFTANKVGDSNWIDSNDLEEESVYIVFDNPASVDALISQLEYIKEQHLQNSIGVGVISETSTM